MMFPIATYIALRGQKAPRNCCCLLWNAETLQHQLSGGHSVGKDCASESLQKILLPVKEC